MSNDLILSKNLSGHLTQYKEMCRAVAVCHQFDECKDIIDKSVAMAAYYAQIKDTETELMFQRIRVRAWRRIGELFSPVSFTDCETQAAKVRKIRAAFPDDPTVSDMSDSRILEILRLMEIPDKEFESAIKQTITGSLPDLFKRTPSAIAQRLESERYWAKRREKEEEERQFAAAVAAQDRAVAVRAAKKEATLLEKHGTELYAAADQAMKEVGITLERKDRAKMKQVVFLIKQEVHEVLRQAAFDKRVTMQEVLRRGLKLWLEANGYDWPDDDTHSKGGYDAREETENRTT